MRKDSLPVRRRSVKYTKCDSKSTSRWTLSFVFGRPNEALVVVGVSRPRFRGTSKQTQTLTTILLLSPCFDLMKLIVLNCDFISARPLGYPSAS